jgi:hypothetical protein
MKGKAMKQIRILLGNLVLDARLNGSPTARKVWGSLAHRDFISGRYDRQSHK